MYFGAEVHERAGVDENAEVDEGTLVYFGTPGVDESAIAVAGADDLAGVNEHVHFGSSTSAPFTFRVPA